MAFYVRASAFEIPPPSEKDFDIHEDQDEVFPPLKGKKKVINEAINRIFDETWNRIKETGDDEDFETPKGMSFRISIDGTAFKSSSSDCKIRTFELLLELLLRTFETRGKVETFFNSADVKIEAFDLSSNRIFAATQSQQVIVFDALSESVRLGFDKWLDYCLLIGQKINSFATQTK